MVLIYSILFFISSSFAVDFAVDKGRAEYKWLKLPQNTVSLSEVGFDQPIWNTDTTNTLSVERIWFSNVVDSRIDKIALSLPFFSQVVKFDAVLNSGETLEGFDNLGNPTSEFSTQFFGFGVEYQHSIDDLKASARMNYLYSELEAYSSQAFLMDLNLQYELANFSIFGRLQNVGWGGSYVAREIVPPLGMRWGVKSTWKILEWMDLNPFAGIHYQNDEDVFYPLGLEFDIHKILEWRISWAQTEGSSRIGTGVSLHFNWIKLNYGFQSHEYLGGYHGLNVEYPF